MFDIDYKFSYLVLTLPFLIIWVIIFIFKKGLRKEMLIVSSITAIIGPISEIIYFRDYWFPESMFSIFLGSFPVMVEDLLFGFAIGGIAAVIYNFIFNIELVKKRVSTKFKSLRLVSIVMIVLVVLILIGVNSIFASSVAFLSGGLYVLIRRRDLLINSLVSGTFMMVTVFVCYYFLYHFIFSNPSEILSKGWYLYGTSLGTTLFNIPVSELVWAFSWGFLAGPIYEFITNRLSI
ncbi:hypothetical protein H6775_01270 [Candidatus Nomurabacteria bacterium]|nr:hypothetical protein [Candidatus Nomurabacteria bacterium]